MAWWAWTLGLAALAACTWWFLHRDPDRVVEPFEGYLSPADGIVVGIHDAKAEQRIEKGAHGITARLGDLPDARTVVVIMMKPWHVHTQRSPVTGRVKHTAHKGGTLLNAVFGDWQRATVENEHFSVTLAGERACKVYLVAGLLARRIVPVVRRGQHVLQGDRIGSIRFGSQVVLVLPHTDELLVRLGDRVTAGVTRVAR